MVFCTFYTHVVHSVTLYQANHAASQNILLPTASFAWAKDAAASFAWATDAKGNLQPTIYVYKKDLIDA